MIETNTPDKNQIFVGDEGLTPSRQWSGIKLRLMQIGHGFKLRRALPAIGSILVLLGLGSWLVHDLLIPAADTSHVAMFKSSASSTAHGAKASSQSNQKTSSSSNTVQANKSAGGKSTPSSAPASTPPPPSSGSPSLIPPPIPSTGAYLGAWLNISGATGSSELSNELQELPGFNQNIGRQLSIVNFYPSFNAPVPTSTLTTISQNGAIPLISWSCANISAINSGADNGLITAYANGLKAFGKPVFMRWYWEMNLNASFNQSCGGYNNGAAYVTAWKTIWNTFHQVGATNVAFVWNPDVGGGDASQYYPGDAYVDWIGADGYDLTNTGTTAFGATFNKFYNEWAGHSKPIFIGETGAQSGDQVGFLQGMQQSLPSKYPNIKAVVYWDASGSTANWILQGSGFSTFTALAHTQYFNL